MIFECVYCTFCDVTAMGARGDKLEVNIIFAEIVLHGVGVLVVVDVESGGYIMLE